jgi:hypothetical protein
MIVTNFNILWLCVPSQVQAICNHMGTITWYSGSHLGVTHDLRLFREHMPALQHGERILGDKAYVGHHRLLAPHKAARRAVGLTRRQMAYNIVHSWYRATIEHCFAYLKRSVTMLTLQSLLVTKTNKLTQSC